MSSPSLQPRERAMDLLRRRDFRTLYLAVSASELGDALQYIALMWFALEQGGALGVVAVRLADSLPALIFGLHGGIAADRWSRRRLMIGADLARGIVLIPVAIAGLTGSLPLWGLVVAAFLIETASSYFAPAYGATVVSLVERENVQTANALVQATLQAVSVGGWALAAGLVAFLPISTFFAVNAVSFFLSAALIMRLREGREPAPHGDPPRLREGIAALRPRRSLSIAVVVYGVAMTITTGCWIAGVPTLIRSTLHRGAGGFALVMIGFAVGSIIAGSLLARIPIRAKSRASDLSWTVYGPAFGLIAVASSVPVAFAGAIGAGAGESAAYVLLASSAQEEIPDAVLGRVLGVIAFVHRGSHALGLLLVAPIFAIAAAPNVFVAAAIAVPAVGLAGYLIARRTTEVPAPVLS